MATTTVLKKAGKIIAETTGRFIPSKNQKVEDKKSSSSSSNKSPAPTQTERELSMSLPESTRNLPKEEVKASQSLSGGQSIDTTTRNNKGRGGDGGRQQPVAEMSTEQGAVIVTPRGEVVGSADISRAGRVSSQSTSPNRIDNIREQSRQEQSNMSKELSRLESLRRTPIENLRGTYEERLMRKETQLNRSAQKEIDIRFERYQRQVNEGKLTVEEANKKLETDIKNIGDLVNKEYSAFSGKIANVYTGNISQIEVSKKDVDKLVKQGYNKEEAIAIAQLEKASGKTIISPFRESYLTEKNISPNLSRSPVKYLSMKYGDIKKTTEQKIGSPVYNFLTTEPDKSRIVQKDRNIVVGGIIGGTELVKSAIYTPAITVKKGIQKTPYVGEFASTLVPTTPTQTAGVYLFTKFYKTASAGLIALGGAEFVTAKTPEQRKTGLYLAGAGTAGILLPTIVTKTKKAFTPEFRVIQESAKDTIKLGGKGRFQNVMSDVEKIAISDEGISVARQFKGGGISETSSLGRRVVVDRPISRALGMKPIYIGDSKGGVIIQKSRQSLLGGQQEKYIKISRQEAQKGYKQSLKILEKRGMTKLEAKQFLRRTSPKDIISISKYEGKIVQTPTSTNIYIDKAVRSDIPLKDIELTSIGEGRYIYSASKGGKVKIKDLTQRFKETSIKGEGLGEQSAFKGASLELDKLATQGRKLNIFEERAVVTKVGEAPLEKGYGTQEQYVAGQVSKKITYKKPLEISTSISDVNVKIPDITKRESYDLISGIKKTEVRKSIVEGDIRSMEEQFTTLSEELLPIKTNAPSNILGKLPIDKKTPFSKTFGEPTIKTYHSTKAQNLPSILKDGLKPSSQTGIKSGLAPKNYVSTGKTLEGVKGFGAGRTSTSKDTAIFEIEMPESVAKELITKERIISGVDEIPYDKVPPQYLKLVEVKKEFDVSKASEELSKISNRLTKQKPREFLIEENYPSMVGGTGRQIPKVKYGRTDNVEVQDIQPLSLTIPNQQSRTINLNGQGTYNFTKIDNKQNIDTINKFGSGSSSNNRFADINIVKTEVTPKQIDKIKESQVFKQEYKLEQKLQQRLQQRLIQKQIQKQQLKIKTPPFKITTIIPKPTSSITQRVVKKMEDRGLFEVFVTKKGKDISLGEFQSKEKAELILKKELKGTLRAGGYITKDKRSISPTQLKGFGSDEFAISKVNPFKVIQKKEKRLGTKPETSEIQYFKKSKGAISLI